MHLPEFRNMVSSRTVEAPCSSNEDTFPREKSVETLISMGVPLTKQAEILAAIVSEKRRLLTRVCRIGSIIIILKYEVKSRDFVCILIILFKFIF
ncbi:hypothetical protein NC652_037889 [Populus alba x Populus x berolinensis]|nr:hypothetical protein NC652_037889 [Populus alba x Populus x berolinensis]